MATLLPSRAKVAAGTFEVQMQRRRLIAGSALVLTLLLSLIGTTPFQSWTMSDADAQGDIVRQLMMLGIVAILPFAPANARPPMAVPLSIVILLGYCLMTALWAIEPMVSLRRLAFTAIVIWTLVRCIGDLGAVRTLTIVRAVLVLVLIICYAMVFLSPFGRHSALDAEAVVGDWRGIMPHKNVAGATCALTILFFAFDRGRIPLWVNILVCLASVFFLLMTGSKTSMAVLAIAIAAGAIMLLYNPRSPSIIWPVGLVGAAGLIGLLVMYLGVLEAMLEDPTSFSGRASIWPVLLDYASNHLWTGAGFGSFWQIGPSSPVWKLASGWVASAVSHGHNGYLDLLVTIGLPGLLLAVAVLLVWPALRLLYSQGITRPRRALLMAVLVFCAAHNMSESSLFDRAAIVQVFLMVVVILIHRLSSQSLGHHHALRERFVQLAGRDRLERLRRRFGADSRSRQARSAARWAARSAARSMPEDGTA